MAKPLIEVENPIILDRPVYRYTEPTVIFKPVMRCMCGCNEVIDEVELRTHEGEPVASEACFLQIAYKEGWLKRVG